ncbi:hypothetical protein Tco_1433685 [Tanacetum coccineum]
MPLPLFSSLGGVGENLDKVVLNKLSMNCFIVMFYGKIEFRGVGDEVLGFGIKNFSLLKGGYSSETFSSEVWTNLSVDKTCGTCSVIEEACSEFVNSCMNGRFLEHLPFHHPLVAAPLELDQWYLDMGSPFPTSPPQH